MFRKWMIGVRVEIFFNANFWVLCSEALTSQQGLGGWGGYKVGQNPLLTIEKNNVHITISIYRYLAKRKYEKYSLLLI